MEKNIIQNGTVNAMIDRRSCRKYSSEQIAKKELDTVLEAGLYAASGNGLQAAYMVVIQEKEVLRKLSKINAEIMGSDSDPFYGAPTAVLVLADADKKTCVEDGSLVLGNLMLAAHSIGLGSCWINRAKETFEREEEKALLKKWGLEGNYVAVGYCILGYSEEGEKKPAKRKENRMFYV